MKVLVLSTDFKPRPGGVAELAHQVARGLALRGHQVVVATDKRSAPDWRDDTQPYAVRRVLNVRRFLSRRNPVGLIEFAVWSLRSRRRLRAMVGELQPDAVLATNCNSLWLPVVSASRVPFLQYVVGEDAAVSGRREAPLARRGMTRTLGRASRVIAISDYASRLVSSLGTDIGKKVSVVPCGVPDESIVPAGARNGRHGQRLLTVARLELRKGIDTTLRTVACLVGSIPTLRYTIVGDGPDKAALQSLAHELGIYGHVEFTGFVNESQKREIYLNSDLYVMPSRPGTAGECEGFGISFLEANAMGLPVIGSTAGGIPDAVEHGVNGLLVPPDDPRALAAAIRTLLSDPEQGRRMALAGQERIRRRFNWQAIAQCVEKELCGAVARSCDVQG